MNYQTPEYQFALDILVNNLWPSEEELKKLTLVSEDIINQAYLEAAEMLVGTTTELEVLG